MDKLEEIKCAEWVLICGSCFKIIRENFQESRLNTFYLDYVDHGSCSMNNCSNEAVYYIFFKEIGQALKEGINGNHNSM